MPGSRKVWFESTGGQLEGLWRSGREGPTTSFDRAVILCHPHPLHGGTMENKVIARSARYLADAGHETLRFNFRGVGQSQGAFDAGRGEREDVEAALRFVSEQSPAARIAVVGYSFGSWVGTAVGVRNEQVDGLVAIAPPLTMYDFSFLAGSPKAKLIVYGGRDGFLNVEAARQWIAGCAPPVEQFFVPDADHFFGPYVDDVARAVTSFVEVIWRRPA